MEDFFGSLFCLVYFGYEMQVGCGDYDIAGKEDLVSSLPKNEQGFVRLFPDMKDKFIELWHPDYDVAGISHSTD